MSRPVNCAYRIVTLGVPALSLLFGCGGNSGVAAGDGGASADGSAAAEAQVGDVTAANEPTDSASGESNGESSVEASVQASDANGGCAPPLQVYVTPANSDEAYLAVSADGSQCSADSAPVADAVLVYQYLGGGAGDLPSGRVWVPTGSPWHILTQDGGLWGQGQSSATTLTCSAALPLMPISLRLTNGSGDILSLSVACNGGLVFVVQGVSVTSGGASLDASQG
jgi:hypothetical protein